MEKVKQEELSLKRQEIERKAQYQEEVRAMNASMMDQRRTTIMQQRQEKEATLEKVKQDLQFKYQIKREMEIMKREEKEESCRRLARQEEYKRA